MATRGRVTHGHARVRVCVTCVHDTRVCVTRMRGFSIDIKHP